MEFSLEGTTQAAMLARDGACLVNIPSPSRYAVHKLMVFGERDTASRARATEDIEQAAALAEWHLLNGQAQAFRVAWTDGSSRGRGWKARALQGRRALLAKYPSLDGKALWG